MWFVASGSRRTTPLSVTCLRDLVVLSGKARDRQGSELGELRDLLVAGDDVCFELGVLCLEPFNQRAPGIDKRSDVALRSNFSARCW